MSDEKTTSRATSGQQTRGAFNAILENTCAVPWPLEVLIATADADVRRSLTDLLAENGLSPVLCSSLSEAQSILVREPICLVFCDYHLPDGNFRDVLYEVRRHAPSVPVVVSNRMGGCHQFLSTLKSGAFDYIDCVWPRQELQQIVRQALRTVSLRSLNPLADLPQELRRNS
jgi:two-component system, NtrC family, nitrogen regulation response regulator NtrX